MPGNRALYDRAMEQTREAARQKNWEEALKQAVRALQEFPQDADARSSVAVAVYARFRRRAAPLMRWATNVLDAPAPHTTRILIVCPPRPQ